MQSLFSGTRSLALADPLLLSYDVKPEQLICTSSPETPSNSKQSIFLLALKCGLVAPRSAFGRPDLIHLCNPFLELFVLAFLVRMSLVLEKFRVSE